MRVAAMATAAGCDSLAGFICAVAKDTPSAAEEWMEGARKFFHANHDPHRESASPPRSRQPSLGVLLRAQPARHEDSARPAWLVLESPGRVAPDEFAQTGAL